ncbi:hypothetical protein [Phytomonospora endophytica]|uniref:Uncharacterized protein n=1 Tax=Phytomonospora endophytica TaxID=714109 RepID=A0A841FJI9_9ACTN|nr:hypothetical protein [Phytomonospora endophytica]MBB6036044.1 hypothetical protein [Phytomonospora endophytica]GIG66949.1 hypothetical protein Pen01_32440 [Phytomonospora endophytica]
MKNRKLRYGLVVLAAAGVAALSATSAYASGPLDWTQTTTPEPGNWYSFDDMEILSKKDAWASGGGPDIPMLAHWNGKAWAQTAAPADVLYVSDIDAAASDDIWGVGAGGETWYEGRVMHYDGDAWTGVKAPMPDVGHNGQVTMNDVVADGDEVWATGMANRSIDGERVNNGFVLHFDGETWTVEELPIPADSTDVLYTGLAVLDGGDVVTTGVRFVPIPEDPDFSRAEPWVLRYDGAQWTNVGYADFGEVSKHGDLSAMAVDAEGEGIWASGTLWQDGVPEPYLVHYDGDSGEWTRPKLPTVAGSANGALAVDKRGGVVLGVAMNDVGDGGDRLFHYDGRTVAEWTGPQHEGLWTYGVAAFVPGTNTLWLVGCTREENGRPIAGIAAHAPVPLRH